MHRLSSHLFAAALGLAMACVAHASPLPPIQPVAHVDLLRFMGKWYLIAAIPTDYGRRAFNAVQTYTLQPDGDIRTTFSFNDGGFDGTRKHIESTGHVTPGTGNAEWRVKVVWFLRAQYIVAWLEPDYSEMIVARDKRDHVWVFARAPEVTPGNYAQLVARVRALGYPVEALRKVSQQWPRDAEATSTAAQPTAR